MCGCRVRDDALLALACACPRLTKLGTRGCDMLTEAGIVAALCTRPRDTARALCPAACAQGIRIGRKGTVGEGASSRTSKYWCQRR